MRMAACLPTGSDHTCPAGSRRPAGCRSAYSRGSSAPEARGVELPQLGTHRVGFLRWFPADAVRTRARSGAVGMLTAARRRQRRRSSDSFHRSPEDRRHLGRSRRLRRGARSGPKRLARCDSSTGTHPVGSPRLTLEDVRRADSSPARPLSQTESGIRSCATRSEIHARLG